MKKSHYLEGSHIGRPVRLALGKSKTYLGFSLYDHDTDLNNNS